ncbi:MAG: MFS transporter [Actinobacteria bacterium]|nr:MFS transporter [Actinomycetota bacterium]
MTTSDTGSDTAVVAIDPLVFGRRWKILAVLCTSLMVVIVGNTALNVALPTLARELRASTPAQQWMVDGYGLVFAGLLLTAGTIGDRYGRKGALQIGLLIFLAGSLSAAFMDSAGGVIAGRAVMGFGAAFVMPATLSILTNVFPPHERGKAIAIWAGISGGGAAIGPVASGFLLTHFSWGSVFLVNVPIILVALVAGKVLLPTSRDPEPGALDPIGAVLSIAALGALVYAIIEAPHRGWASNASLAWFAAAILLIAAFLMWELRNSAPMLDLRYFLDPRFGVAAGVITLVFFAMFGFFFLLTQYFQLVLGYGTLEAGVKQLPFAAVMMVLAPNSPRLAARFGTNRVVAFGLVCVSCAMFLFTISRIDTSYWALLPVMMTMAGGMALVIPSMTGSIMSAVPLGKAGVGSAMNDTTRELGGALGVAVLGSLVASRYGTRLEPALAILPVDLRERASESLAGALQTASSVDGEIGASVNRIAREAYVSGLHLAAIVAGCVVLLASGIVYRKLPAGNPHAQGAAAR